MPLTSLSTPMTRPFQFVNDTTFCAPRLDQQFDDFLNAIRFLQASQVPRNFTFSPTPPASPNNLDAWHNGVTFHLYSSTLGVWVGVAESTEQVLQTHNTTYPTQAIAGQTFHHDASEIVALRVTDNNGSFWEVL